MRDPLPVRLGELAADLARVTSFSQNPANLAPVADLMREAAHFVEWCALACTSYNFGSPRRRCDHSQRALLH